MICVYLCSSVVSLSAGYADELFRRSRSGGDPAGAVLVQRAKAPRPRQLAQLLLAFALVDRGAQPLVHFEELVDPGAAAVARLAAGRAAHRVPLPVRVLPPAFRAEPAQEPLREYPE